MIKSASLPPHNQDIVSINRLTTRLTPMSVCAIQWEVCL